MIYDIITVAAFVILIILGVKRGAARSLAGMASTFLSYLAATALGKAAASFVYEAMIAPSINRSITNSISELGNNIGSSVTENLPLWLQGLMRISPEDVRESLSSSIDSLSGDAVNTLDSAVRPIVVSVLSFFITLLLFLIIRFILRKFVVRFVLKIFDLPVISAVNHFFGGVIGFVDAFLLVSMAAYLLSLILPLNNTDSYILSESTIYNSFIFYHFYSGNIFTVFTSWIHI